MVDADAKVHDRAVLPEPVTLVGETAHEVLLVVRLTRPGNPLSPETVIVEVPAEFTLTLTLVGLAVIVKSCTRRVTVAEWRSEPLIPITPTWSVPMDVIVHERVELPEPVTLVGLRLQKVLFVVRLRIPVKPFTAVITMLDVAAALTLTLTLAGLAAIVKSWTAKTTPAEWASDVLVPVTLTGNVPVEVKVHERADAPEPVTLVGDRMHEVLLVARLTTPAKPLTPAMVMVDVAAAFTFTLTVEGLALIVKSWITKVTVAEWDSEPLLPVTVT